MKYAIIQYGYVRAVRETRDEAIADMNKQMGFEGRVEGDAIVYADIVVLPCTDALYQAVKERGGNIEFDIDDYEDIAYLEGEKPWC